MLSWHSHDKRNVDRGCIFYQYGVGCTGTVDVVRKEKMPKGCGIPGFVSLGHGVKNAMTVIPKVWRAVLVGLRRRMECYHHLCRFRIWYGLETARPAVSFWLGCHSRPQMALPSGFVHVWEVAVNGDDCISVHKK